MLQRARRRAKALANSHHRGLDAERRRRQTVADVVPHTRRRIPRPRHRHRREFDGHRQLQGLPRDGTDRAPRPARGAPRRSRRRRRRFHRPRPPHHRRRLRLDPDPSRRELTLHLPRRRPRRERLPRPRVPASRRRRRRPRRPRARAPPPPSSSSSDDDVPADVRNRCNRAIVRSAPARRSSRSRHPTSRVDRRLSSRARFFAPGRFLGLGVSPARSARANSATLDGEERHRDRDADDDDRHRGIVAHDGRTLTRRGVTTESDARRVRRARRATRDARANVGSRRRARRDATRDARRRRDARSTRRDGDRRRSSDSRSTMSKSTTQFAQPHNLLRPGARLGADGRFTVAIGAEARSRAVRGGVRGERTRRGTARASPSRWRANTGRARERRG